MSGHDFRPNWGIVYPMTVRRSVTVGAISIAALVGLLLTALAVLWFVQRDRALPNTTVAGIEVSRLTADEVRDVLDPVATARRQTSVVLSFEDDTYTLDPADVGYQLDLDATVQAALGRGREGLPGDVVVRIRSFREVEDLPLQETYDHAALVAWVDDLADQIDREVSPGRVEPDPDTLEVHVELPHGSAEVRREETVELVAGLLTSDGDRAVDLPVDTEPQRVPDDDVLEVAAQVEQSLAGPLVLHGGDASLTLEPGDLARLIDVVERPQGEGATVELVVAPESVGEVVGDAGERFATEPVNARYILSRTPPVRFDLQGSTSFSPVAAAADIEPGQPGTRFSPELAATQLTELLRAGSREAELRLETIEPELSTERAEQLRPTHLLGTFTTYHAAGQARVVNIQRLADEIDGALVLPGEQFSINGISGRRTCERGYQPAGTIIDGELVDTCGGGTSQFGTTTFNAAFFAGVQLDQWKAHSWYISRYPMGREATLNYPELDVKFTNTTDAAIVVKTTYTSSSITVSLFGQPIAERVEARLGSPFNHRGFSTERRSTSELCRGQERVMQSGAGGFSVEVERIVERRNGANNSQTIRTVYVPQTRIVEVGTRNCPSNDDDDDGD